MKGRGDVEIRTFSMGGERMGHTPVESEGTRRGEAAPGERGQLAWGRTRLVLGRPLPSARATALGLLVFGWWLTGCDLGSEVREAPVVLEGTLEPDLPDRPVTGGVAAVSETRNTDVAVAVAEGLEPGEAHPWWLREGTCQGDGRGIVDTAVVPPLEPQTAQGSAEVETQIGGLLDREGSYSAEVFEADAGGADPVRLACADLEPAD